MKNLANNLMRILQLLGMLYCPLLSYISQTPCLYILTSDLATFLGMCGASACSPRAEDCDLLWSTLQTMNRAISHFGFVTDMCRKFLVSSNRGLVTLTFICNLSGDWRLIWDPGCSFGSCHPTEPGLTACDCRLTVTHRNISGVIAMQHDSVLAECHLWPALLVYYWWTVTSTNL